MKNFVAGVLVTSALLLVGFQAKKPKAQYSYQVQKAVSSATWQNQLNFVAGKGGRLVSVTFDGASGSTGVGQGQISGGGYPTFFIWEFEK
jgi:hypothetical protein